MPVVDLSLEELKAYKGINPKPDDFDSYWSAAQDELAAVDPEIELIEAAFEYPGLECFHLRWTGVGGARIYAKYLRPAAERQNGAAIVRFHGYSMHSGSWMSHAGLAASGYHVFAMDCRGQGGLSDDNTQITGNTRFGHIVRGLSDSPEKLYYRQVFLDTVQLARIAMDTEGVDPDRVGADGGSQGGGLSLACAALEPRIAAAAVRFPFLSDYRRVWEMDLIDKAYKELVYWFKRFDPRHLKEDEVFLRLGYIDIQHLADRIRCPVRMATGLMDDVCPPSSQFAAWNRITSEKELAVYPDFGHEYLPGHDDDDLQFFRLSLGIT